MTIISKLLRLKRTKERKEVMFEVKEEYFIQNGAIFLQKQISLSQGRHVGSGQLKVFSFRDIKNATNNFNPTLLVSSNFGRIYKGTLADRPVHIRAPVGLPPEPRFIHQFLTEFAVGTVISHNNVIKIHGCCLETRIPIPVYEFLPNGSLLNHLDGNIPSGERLKWGYRMRVATDIGYALSYMHNALSKPVVHRSLNSTIVILDDSFHGKLSNLGHSVLITPGESTQGLPVQGTPGYIDPEYVETQEVTEKSDVYSFGVMMLEMLTGRHPLEMENWGMSLVGEFLSGVRENRMMEMIDKDVLDQGSGEEIEGFVQLALKCVARKGIERPTMIEVVSELWRIQGRQLCEFGVSSEGLQEEYVDSRFCHEIAVAEGSWVSSGVWDSMVPVVIHQLIRSSLLILLLSFVLLSYYSFTSTSTIR